jgi:spore germination cell wall hydrolase CwlJ-like protein
MAEPVGVATVAAETHSLRTELPLKTTDAAVEIARSEALAPDAQWGPDQYPVANVQTIVPDTVARQALTPIPASQPRSLSELAAAASNGLPSPAQRLRLSAKGRAREETCLAEAIYFEARGETLRGQIAVAQVVMNRVFTRFYPGTVCGVVYQNVHRRNACQFSFACDGKRKVIKDRYAWSVAKYVAALTIDGKVWEPDIAKATHYHATWVDPWWVGTMHKMASHGVHIFYRPLRWGDGSDEPNWSRVIRTALAALH